MSNTMEAAGPSAGGFSRGHRGALVISLDFELHWGVRDIIALDRAEQDKLLAARLAIPHLLDLFEEFSTHASWATVGVLFAHSREEAEAFCPPAEVSYCKTLGADENQDPFHFAPSLIAQIAQRPGQEIASHSFSHFHCMELGQTAADFAADVGSAVAIAANSGYTLHSYVFPRNQVNPEYLHILERAGFWAYRGNEPVATKKAAPFAEQRRLYKRAPRFLDSFLDVDGPLTQAWPQPAGLIPVTASRYLRSYRPVFQPLEPLHLHRIEKAMRYAAEEGEIFHLWWHPEDLAYNREQNLRVLRRVLERFDNYRSRYGMVSLTMSEVARQVRTGARDTGLENTEGLSGRGA